MRTIKGQITRATGGKRRSVYLSDVFGLWPQGKGLHISSNRGKHGFNTTVTRKDGLLYDLLKALYREGMRLP